MQNLWIFLTRHFHWLLFVFLEAVSVVMLFNYNSYQGSTWVSSANAIAGSVYQLQSEVEHFFSLTTQNKELAERNIFLELQLDRYRQKFYDMTGDTTAIERAEFDNMKEFQLISAKVIANSVNSLDNMMTIDRGRADGIQPDMGVVCGNGIVGVTYLVSEHYSVILPALNKRSRISCSIRGQDYFGYLSWDGRDPMTAFVEDIPRHAQFKKGDWIETSGYSSIFPHGISVGKIEKIFNSADGLSFRLQIRLSTDFSCLRDVCIINDKGMAERMRLQEAVNDSLMLKKN